MLENIKPIIVTTKTKVHSQQKTLDMSLQEIEIILSTAFAIFVTNICYKSYFLGSS